MKHIVKYLLITLFAVLVLLVAFFFWASSSNLPKADYSKISVNQFAPKINTDSVYSIITYNVGYFSGMANNKAIEKPKTLFEANINYAKKKLAVINPDIIALQEIDFDSQRSHYIDQQAEIATLGYAHVAQAIDWDQRHVPYPYWPLNRHFGKIVSGQSILSKYQIKSQEREILERMPRPYHKDVFYLDRIAQIVKIVIEDKELVVISVHLEAFDKAIRRKQMQQVINLYKRYYKTQPVIMVGDFNSDPDYDNPAIELMFNLDDTACAAFEKGNYKNTFSTFNPYERLDYIFYNSTFINLIGSQVLTDFGELSDHFPVQMDFKFVNAPML